MGGGEGPGDRAGGRPLKPFSPPKAPWGTRGVVAVEAGAGTPGLGTPVTPCGSKQSSSWRAAHFPQLSASQERSEITQFLEHSGRGGRERGMMDSLLTHTVRAQCLHVQVGVLGPTCSTSPPSVCSWEKPVRLSGSPL